MEYKRQTRFENVNVSLSWNGSDEKAWQGIKYEEEERTREQQHQSLIEK